MYGQERDQRRWLKRFGRPETAGTRLLCFHYAGGSASMFRDWPKAMPPHVDLVAVQLPGRADRFHEPAYRDMASLVEALVEVLEPLLNQPFACYGASMGATVSWALINALAEREMPLPLKLYVAHCPAPSAAPMVRGWNEPDEGLVAYMRDLGGTPPEIMDDPGLLRGLLPALRADLTVLGTRGHRPPARFGTAIHAFAGADDHEVPPERMRPWGLETSACFDLDILPGGHFFSPEGQRHVFEVISNDLG